MMKFRYDFMDLENIDPLQYVTVASVCMTIYRSKYMPGKTIGVVKDVTRGETYSKASWIGFHKEMISKYSMLSLVVKLISKT